MSTTVELMAGFKAANISQTQIAKQAEIPQPRLSRWAKGGKACRIANDALRLHALHLALIGPVVVAEPAPEPKRKRDKSPAKAATA